MIRSTVGKVLWNILFSILPPQSDISKGPKQSSDLPWIPDLPGMEQHGCGIYFWDAEILKIAKDSSITRWKRSHLTRKVCPKVHLIYTFDALNLPALSLQRQWDQGGKGLGIFLADGGLRSSKPTHTHLSPIPHAFSPAGSLFSPLAHRSGLLGSLLSRPAWINGSSSEPLETVTVLVTFIHSLMPSLFSALQ